MKYRKKPLVIDAVQWTGLNLEEVKTFAKGSLDVEIFDAGWKAGAVKPSVKITIHTLEGDMIVNSGDYIIKGVDGEIYPCKPDIFIKTYEKVDAMIEAQPTVGQWIPCSEKLPQKQRWVLITYVWDDDSTCYTGYGHRINNSEFYAISGERGELNLLKNYKVIAWMPLPEPYREEE